MSSFSGILGSDAAIITKLLLQMEHRVVQQVESMNSRVSQRFENLDEIARGRTSGQSSNENGGVSLAFVQCAFIKTISVSDKKR